MKSALMLPPLLLAATFALPAHADPIQPEEPQYQLCTGVSIRDWGDPKEIISMVEEMDFEPLNIRIEKGCWEVKAFDAQREVYELYIHPVSKEIVQRKQKPGESAPQ